jgi:peptidoglycan/xylan/chitin deacetylase (PgdA/CDA1 family)
MEFSTSWDDDAYDNFRLAELLNKHKIPATFFLTNQSDWQMVRQVSSYKTISIGGHTKSHPSDIKTLTETELKSEIKSNKKYLERILEEVIFDFCYPRGRYNQLVIDKVKQAGYKTARTTIVGNIKKPVDLYRINTTIHVYQRAEYKKYWLLEAKDYIKRIKKGEGDYFHLWGHSWEITKFNYWEDLEELLIYANKIFNKT